MEGIEITEVFEEAELRAKYLVAASLVGKEKWAVKAEYRKECTGNVIVLEDEYGYSFENYQIRMLTGNQIPALLECHVQMVDAVLFFHYHTLDEQPLNEKYVQTGMRYEDMEKLLLAIDQVMKAVSEYLLSPAGIVLDPAYIFVNAQETYHFCYLPGRTLSFAEAFRSLSEYILDHMDYGQQRGVVLGYGIYRKSQEAQACMESLMGLLRVQPEGISVVDQADAYELWDGGGWRKQGEYAVDFSGYTESRPKTAENIRSKRKAKAAQKTKSTVGRKHMKENTDARADGASEKKANGKWLRNGLMLFFGILCGGVALFRAYVLTDAGAEIKVEAVSSESSFSVFQLYGPWIALGCFTLGMVVLFARIFYRKKNVPNQEQRPSVRPVEPTRYLGSPGGEMPHKLIRMDTQEEVLLSGSYMKIGKDQQQVDIWVQAETVSRVHAAVFREKGEWCVQDLASTNGTFLNSHRLQREEKATLVQGDELLFADQAFLFL